MSLAAAADAYEAYDTACPCPSNEDLQRDWFASAAAEALPWDEIEPADHDTLDVAATTLESILRQFFRTASTRRWLKMPPEEKAANVERLMALPQVPQRTADWYAQSKSVLTASEFSEILGTPRAVGSLVMKKVAPIPEVPIAPRLACASTEMSAMDWGVRFEPVVKEILSHKWGAEIVELGRICHATDAHLAASPDGIILTAAEPERVGRLVEIKCPIRREITGAIPFEYWCQMQIQMEVCDVDECEFVEVKINSAYKIAPFCTEMPEGSQRHLYSGLLWLLQEPDTLELKYAYSKLERADLEAAGWNIVEEIPWNLDILRTQVVTRDRLWFEGTAAAREAFWSKVAEAAAGIFQLPASTRGGGRPKAAAAPIVQVCKIMD